MAIQIRCRNPKGKVERMEIKLEQPWTANELTAYLRDAGRPCKTFIFLVPAEKRDYARSWEEF